MEPLNMIPHADLNRLNLEPSPWDAHVVSLRASTEVFLWALQCSLILTGLLGLLIAFALWKDSNPTRGTIQAPR